MKKKLCMVAVFLIMSLVFSSSLTWAAASERIDNSQVELSLNGELLNLHGPGNILALRQGLVYIQLAELMDILDGSLNWQEKTRTALAKWQSKTIDFRINSDLCTVNGQTVKLADSSYLEHNRLMVPLRSTCQILGVKLDWDAQNRIVDLDVPDLLQTERLYNPAIPARIAFINHDHLFIIDGSQAGSQPVLISSKGQDEIIGWSADGQWLAYLNSPAKGDFSDEQYLWVVRADGSGATRIDSHPLTNDFNDNIPAWSPRANFLAYTYRESVSSYDSVPVVNIASYQDEKWKLEPLKVPGSSDPVADLAWAPDGQSLAISLPARGTVGLRIERLSLSGQSSPLLTLNNSTIPQESANQEGRPWAASAMKWSPDGRYLAYYLHPQSASLAADENQLQVLDSSLPDKTFDLGCGLAYSEWLKWSCDSKQLAYIEGCGRDVISNKKLKLADFHKIKLNNSDISQPGQVDVQPLWIPATNTLLFCRGAENENYYDSGKGLIVPGQRIWQRSATAEMKIITAGSEDNADYTPTVSNDGQNLIYLQLNDRDHGSICLLPMNTEQSPATAKPIVALSGGSAGYYGNYLPAWFSVYWTR